MCLEAFSLKKGKKTLQKNSITPIMNNLYIYDVSFYPKKTHTDTSYTYNYMIFRLIKVLQVYFDVFSEKRHIFPPTNP